MTTVRAHLYVDSDSADDALAAVLSELQAEGWDVDTDPSVTWVHPLEQIATSYIGFGAQEQPCQVTLTAAGRTENDAAAAGAVYSAIRKSGYISLAGDAATAVDQGVVAGGKVAQHVGENPGEFAAGALHAADDFTVAVVVAGVVVLSIVAAYFYYEVS